VAKTENCEKLQSMNLCLELLLIVYNNNIILTENY